jgi:peptide/nickel transport system substrate-binding protein
MIAATWAGPVLAQDATDRSEPSLLRVGIMYDLYTSNPLRACGCGAEYRWMSLQYDLLLNFDPATSAAAPGLATEVPSVENGGISDDHLTYTFNIRDDATWQDGEPVTARDVAFTYRFVLDNGFGALNNYLPYDPTFETPDDRTLIWHQSKPSLAPILPPYIPILPEHIWSKFDGDPKAAKQFENIPAIGSGPFQLTEWREGQFFQLEANADYWGGAPNVDGIVFQTFENAETMALALRDGELDVASGFPPNIYRSLDGQPGITTYEAAGRGFMNLAFNFGGQGDGATNHPALQDVTVRRAIALAIDRQALVDRVLLGQGEPGAGVVPPSNARWYWAPDPGDEYKVDIDAANELLDDAGYRDTDADGVREMPGGGDPLELQFMAASSVASATPSARLIAQWLAEIGIRVQVKSLGDGAMSDIWSRGDFDAYLWGWNGDPDPDFILSIFTTAMCGSWSDGCYSDPAYDRMYDEQRTATSVDERKAIVDEMESYIYDRLPELVLYYESDLEAYRTDRFTGFTPFPADASLVYGLVAEPYMVLEPVTAADGDVASGGSSVIPLWVWGAAIGAIVAATLVVRRVRRSTADDRI